MNNIGVIGNKDGVQIVVRPKEDAAAGKIVSLTEGDEIEVKIKCNVGCDHRLRGIVRLDPDGPSYRFVNADMDLSLRTLLKMGAAFDVIAKKSGK